MRTAGDRKSYIEEAKMEKDNEGENKGKIRPMTGVMERKGILKTEKKKEAVLKCVERIEEEFSRFR